jgi:polyisoprenoid-binding protein YceI
LLRFSQQSVAAAALAGGTGLEHDAVDMRHILFSLALCTAAVSMACQSQLDDKPKAEVKDAKPKTDGKTDGKTDAPDAKALAHASTIVKLDQAGSRVGFVGAKVTADHEGSFKEIAGSLTLADDGKPTSLEVTAKLASLETDAADLTKHLLTADFFDAPTYPEAKFVSTAIREKAGEGGATHELEGELTLHGQTKVVTFPATVEVTDEAAKGTAEFKIDRKLWGITYPGMQDDLIKDEVLLKLSLVYPRA